MSFIKRASRKLAIWLLSFSLFAGASVFALSATAGSALFVKESLDKSGFYKNIIPATLLLITDSQTGGQKLPQKTVDELTSVIQTEQVLGFLQSTTESMIDATYVWLAGTDPYPQLSINTTEVAKVIQTATKTYLANRLVSLPVCQSGSIQTADPFTITCKPNIPISDSSITQVAQDFTDSLPLFTDQNITIDSLGGASAFTTGNAAYAPKVYSWLKKAPFIVLGVGLASLVLILLLTKNTVRAWRTIGHSFVWAGVLLIIVGAITLLLLNRFMDGFIGTASQQQLYFVTAIFSPVLRLFSRQFADYSLYFGVTYAIIGGACYGISHLFQLRENKLAEPQLPDNQNP